MSPSPSPRRAPGRSARPPTAALLLGLLITLATVVAYSWYISRQISGLRRLQTELTDRNRRDSLQLLRIQNDLNQLALAMRDMLDTTEPYPLDRVVGAVRAHPPRSGRRAEAGGSVSRGAADARAGAVPGERRWRSSGTRRTASSRWRAPGRRTKRARRSGCRCRRGRRRSAPPWRGCSSRTTRAKSRRRSRCRTSTAASSGRSTGSWRRRSPRSPPPACT